MANEGESIYSGREQSQIKHAILEKYLERFARIIGKGFDRIVYIDGFSGPWNVQAADLSDSSFAIALGELRKARDTVRQVFGRDLRITCLFLERDRHAYAQLKAFADAQSDADVRAFNMDFESAIPTLLSEIRSAGRGSFPFFFIDPKGWKGFSLDLIKPLLEVRPCEVLINFMTSFILRFIEDERTGLDESFQRLFGDSSFRSKFEGMVGRDREDGIVFEYANRVARTGGFVFVPVTVVPHPLADRTYFHLVYGTRNLKGLEVFKEAERHAWNLADEVRANAKKREREARTNQGELFGGNLLPETALRRELDEHYGTLARERIHSTLRTRRQVPFDELYGIAACYPLVQLSSVREWVDEIAEIENMKSSERVAKLHCEHIARLRE